MMDEFDGVTLTWHEGDTQDGIGIDIGEREHCEDADDLLKAAAEAVRKKFKEGAKIVYAGTSVGSIEPGALILIPSSLFKPRGKATALKAAEKVVREFWPSVEIRTVEKRRER